MSPALYSALDFQSRYLENLVNNFINTVFDNNPVLLHQNFGQAASPTISRARDHQTIPPNSFTYRKTSCLVAAKGISVLLFVISAGGALCSSRKSKHTSIGFLLIPLYTTMTLKFFNSTSNPILYCWKFKEVRRDVKEIFPSGRM